MSLHEKGRSAELNTLIRKAALTINPQGRLSVLAKKAGVTTNAVYKAIKTGRVSSGLACAIEMAVGADVLSKETLCPEKFAK